jgi:hypothetical protein
MPEVAIAQFSHDSPLMSNVGHGAFPEAAKCPFSSADISKIRAQVKQLPLAMRVEVGHLIFVGFFSISYDIFLKANYLHRQAAEMEKKIKEERKRSTSIGGEVVWF